MAFPTFSDLSPTPKLTIVSYLNPFFFQREKFGALPAPQSGFDQLTPRTAHI